MRINKWIAFVGCLTLIGMLSGCALFNVDPVVNFSWSPQDPLARTDVQFTDLSTDVGGLFGGGGVVSWNWDFGDNGSSTSRNPKHSYQVGDTYTVRLTVADDSGATATLSKTITVNPSLDGTWVGTLDDNGFPMSLTLFVQHSSSGGIGGTGNFGGLSLAIMSGSLTGSQVTLVFAGSRVLSGTLDFSQRGMAGTWSVGGMIGFGWNVQR
jgi:PKD repeat protein